MRPNVSRLRALPAVLVGGLVGISGCAGPGPKLFPPVPLQQQFNAEGFAEQYFDTDRDGRPDYSETYAAGRLIAIGYDCNRDGRIDERISLDEIPAEERRYLVLLLDSVPFHVMADLWRQGRFRYCPRPARVISPFPVMTDLSFTEFFGASPSPGIESEYYDGRRLKNGYSVYMNEGNARWTPHTDYHMAQLNHGNAYLNVEPWFGHELRRIQKLFLRGDRRMVIGYCVGTSGLGAFEAENGHRAAMITVDRLCHELLRQTRGRARFALLSDHGHFFTTEESRRVDVRGMLRRCGYHVTDRLCRAEDVIVPEFEMVSASSIHTLSPGPVARDAVGIEGIELAVYKEGERLVVLGKGGKATVSRSGSSFRYETEYGDPLALKPILEQLGRDGRMDADGSIDDRVWFEATLDHAYPDPLARLWRAFHGLVAHTPEVILSLDNGYHTGSKLQTALTHLIGVHGNLRQASSNGFAMTSEGELPADLRMENLREAMRGLGVPFEAGAPEDPVGPVERPAALRSPESGR